MRLIDADELIVMEYGGIRFVPVEFINDAPTIEERKTGKWEHPNRCSECGFGVLLSPYMHNLDTGEYTLLYKFCPNCGARMEENDET